jgi:hypothetical protein
MTLCKIKDGWVGLFAQHATHKDLYSALAGKVAAFCMPIWSPYKWNFEDLKKSVRFMRMSGFWHFFQIFKIQLLSAPNWHAK